MLDVFLEVTGGFKNPLSRPGSPILRRSVFQVVYPGYCQTTVNSVYGEVRQLRDGSTARRLGTNIDRRSVVTASLFCYSPRVFEILRRAWESERLAE
jgi:hypothetical protein